MTRNKAATDQTDSHRFFFAVNLCREPVMTRGIRGTEFHHAPAGIFTIFFWMA
jgi:hypothetical protein